MSFLYFLEGLRNTVLDAFFSFITQFGEETIFMAVGMVVFWCVDKYKGYYLLCVGFLGTVLNQFLKILCRIPRPWIKDPDFTIVESAREAATGYSFPSGHTQTAVGLYGGIARVSKHTAVRVIMLVLTALVALSRMYLGVHTPADVLTSVGIGAVLVFVMHPLFRKAKHSPRIMIAVLVSFIALMIAYLCFVCWFPFPDEVYAAQAIHNLESARKNGFTLLGCAAGLLLAYVVDCRWLHFETKAVWWAQIAKTVGGILLVLAAKELLRTPLDAAFGGHLAARSVRYFLVVVVGGILWPMTFKFFAKLGKSAKKREQPST